MTLVWKSMEGYFTIWAPHCEIIG